MPPDVRKGFAFPASWLISTSARLSLAANLI